MPGLLAGCTLLVAFWIVASRRHEQPFKPFNLTYADFAGYCPAVTGAHVNSVAWTTHDPAEPNIAAFGVVRDKPKDPASLLVRLVHGYNMPMCMKIKGYTVEELARLPGRPVIPVQTWRVTSSAGEVSIWATTMIKSEDFSVTTVAVTSMAFPRVDVPDDPNWVPQGFSKEDLHHPVQSFTAWARARWNASRTDILTFLRLKQPAWASEELVTYVTRSLAPPVTPEREPEMIYQVVMTHTEMLKQLQAWRREHRSGGKTE